MNREALLEEIDRLLTAGEPLLTAFPKQHPDGWVLQLPDNISPEMRWYANDVAWRAWDRKRYQEYQDDNHQASPVYLAGMVKILEVGLLGWRAIGVLK